MATAWCPGGLELIQQLSHPDAFPARSAADGPGVVIFVLLHCDRAWSVIRSLTGLPVSILAFDRCPATVTRTSSARRWSIDFFLAIAKSSLCCAARSAADTPPTPASADSPSSAALASGESSIIVNEISWPRGRRTAAEDRPGDLAPSRAPPPSPKTAPESFYRHDARNGKRHRV